MAGAVLQMLVLAPGHRGCVGVDLASGALVRAAFRPGAGLMPFDVAAGFIAERPDPDDEFTPAEAVTLHDSPERRGRITGKRAERWLRPLLHPRRVPVLGSVGPAIPYWSIRRDRPTVTLLEPEAGPQLVRTAEGQRCRFGWHGSVHDLPFVGVSHSRPNGARLIIELQPPQDGYCYKVVTAALPR